MKEINEFDFELDLNFSGNKNPSEALNQLAKIYDKLLEFDNHVLYNIFIESKIEYQLVDIQYGSIKTKVVQIVKSIPDDFLKEILNPSAWIGLILVTLKHKLLQVIGNNEINDAESLQKITNEINNTVIKELPQGIMYFELNNFYILNTAQEISLLCSKLDDEESYVYKSKGESVRINNKAFIDVPNIIKELGSQTLTQQRIEILKVKTIELLSNNTKWKLIREGKQIEVKISHIEWLDDYHSRKIVIQPNDFLKIELKITHTINQNSKKPIVTYEALKVYDVIPPKDDDDVATQGNLF